MHKPDRIGALVITFGFFALYVAVANWLNWLGLVFLPLGTIQTMPVMALDVAVLSLYFVRQRELAQTDQSPAG